MSRRLFTFSGECTLQRNGIEVALKNNKSKTKTFRLTTTQTQADAVVLENTCHVDILVGNSEEILHSCKLEHIRKLHSNFIQEGRITLQVAEPTDTDMKKNHLPSDISLKDAIKTERFLFIMIKGVAPDQLKPFCQLLSQIKSRKAAANPSTNPNANKTAPQALPGQKPNVNAQRVSMVRTNSINSNSNSNDVMAIEKEDSNQRLLRKSSTTDNENSRFKVNRGIMSEISKGDVNGPLKRKYEGPGRFGAMEIEMKTQKVKVTPRLKKSLLEYLNDNVVAYVLKFLTPKEYINQKLVCKSFYKLINSSKNVLDFRRRGDIPASVIIKYLNSCVNIEKLHMGPSKHLTQRQFLEDVHLHLPRIKLIDMTYFNNMSDKMAMKIYRTCKSVQTLKFGYYSNVTDTVIETLPSYLDKVKGLYFKCPNKNNNLMKRDNITDICFAKFLGKYNKLETLSIFMIGPNFLGKALANPLANLTTLKFENIMLPKDEDLSLISNLKHCVNLETLKIGNIRVGQWDLVLLPREKTEIFGAIFRATPKLKSIKFGQFTGNDLVKEIGEQVPTLKKLVVYSESLDDEGLAHVLKRAELLSHLDISRCVRINGFCLEELVSQEFRRLVVSFEDYRCKCTHAILLQKGLLGQTLLVNVKHRK